MSGIECAFVGVLGRDAESRTSKAGKPYLKLNCRVGDGDGGQWVSIMLFGELAQDLTSRAMLKGARIYVECNNLRIDEWTGQDGTKRTGLGAMSWYVRPCEIGDAKPKGEHTNNHRPAAHSNTNDFYNDEIPL
jgi:single-stranded DNA-binding protein